MKFRSIAFTAPLAALLLAAPGAVQAQQVQSISQADKEAGAKAHPQLLEEFGGAMTGPQAAYVESVGKAIAVQSGLSNAKGDFTVTLLNSPVNNAFAIPGGYIYVTRDLVALMNNEAELAGVLGHEVGHVAAQHQRKRQNTANLSSIFGTVAQAGGSQVGGIFGALLTLGGQTLPQLYTLKYSRGQETQADNLGIEYLRRAGYDPHAMGSVLDSLSKQNALDALVKGNATARVPEWASTHPADARRIREALAKAGSAGGDANRDRFLAGIDGLMVGDDPKQGMIDGRAFVHPDLALRFEAPEGFFLVNGTRAVSITGQAGKGTFGSDPYSGNIETYVTNAFAGLAGEGKPAIRPASISRTTINGMPAAYGIASLGSGSSAAEAMVMAYELAPGKAVHFVTMAAPGSSQVFDPMFRSLRRISKGEAASVRPRRLTVVTVKKGDTVQALAKRMAYSTYQLDRFLILNALTPKSVLTAGQKVKIVTFGS